MKAIKKITAFMLTSAIIIGCLMGETITAKADSKNRFKYINLNYGKVTVGKVTFELKREGPSSTESEYDTIYYTSGGKQRIFYEDQAGYVSNSLVTNGKVAYYVSRVNTVRCKNLKTGSDNKIFTEKVYDYMDPVNVINGRLYYTKDFEALKYYDLKTGKRKKVLSDVASGQSNGNYIYCTPQEGDPYPLPLRVYNTKTGKAKTIAKQMSIYKVISGKLYYVSCKDFKEKNANYVATYSVYRANASGSGKKLLFKKKITGQIYDVSKNSITYQEYIGDSYVRHTLKF